MKTIKTMGPILAVALMSAGCVSTSKYKKLEADNGALKAQMTSLEQELGRSKQEKEALLKASEETQNEYAAVVDQLANEVEAGQLKVTQYKNMLTVDVAEKIFFDSGQAKLKATGKQVLLKVGKALAQYNDKIIRVVGHTDNVPVAKKYRNVVPTNWELSVLRATNVVRFLEEKCKIDPKNLIAAGRGASDPVAPNDTPEGRQKNRRIEIMLIDKSLLPEMQRTAK
jgi:chemotaxis protein MotB